jgi:prepilin-type N-terminal cleavage/methylation domain-containing protein
MTAPKDAILVQLGDDLLSAAREYCTRHNQQLSTLIRRGLAREISQPQLAHLVRRGRPPKRRGFTLVELLVVVAILLLLSTLALAVFNSRQSDKMRSAARIAQSAFLGAKDRALHAKANRGLRMIVDPSGPTLPGGQPAIVTGFAYLQPISHEPYPAGSIQLERPQQNGTATTQDITIIRSISADWTNPQVSGHFAIPSQIRIPAGTGQWYQFVNQGNGVLQLYAPLNPPNANSFPAPIAVTGSTPWTSCEIQFSPEVLPFHQPISLPSGCVADLRFSSANLQTLAASGSVDVMFSPRGSVAGPIGGSGTISLCLRALDDALSRRDPADPQNTGDILLLSVNPQTGLVSTYDADLTDADNDGKADNLFRFVQNGKSAGR